METKKAVVKKVSVLNIMAAKFNLEPDIFLSTIKATVMKPGKDGRVPSNEEIAAFLVVANKYNLDPFTNEIYAFPNKKGGIIPIVGIDGFTTILNRQKGFNGYELTYSEDETTMDGGKQCPAWAEVKIYHKDREHPTIVREYLDEVYIAPRSGFSGPWQSHTKRMLRHKVLIQGIRVAFGITGIYDPDEAERILEAQVIEPKTGKPAVDMPQEIDLKPAESDKKEAPTQDSVSIISEAQAKRLYAIAKASGYTDADVKAHLDEDYGLTSAADIPKEFYDDIIERFQVKKEKNV